MSFSDLVHGSPGKSVISVTVRFTELAEDKSATLAKLDLQKRQLEESAVAAEQKDRTIAELGRYIRSRQSTSPT